MTSIIVYKSKLSGPSDPKVHEKRRAGMQHAGAALRCKLKDAENDGDVERVVRDVVDILAKSADENAFLETGDPNTPDRYEIKDKQGQHFKLEKLGDSSDNERKLFLYGVIDDSSAPGGNEKQRNYRMTAVSPFKPDPVTGWEYLAATVHADLQEIQKLIDERPPKATSEDIENYLIATFAFTRCR